MSSPSLSPSPSPSLVADLQQLILGDRSRNMLSGQFFIYTKTTQQLTGTTSSEPVQFKNKQTHFWYTGFVQYSQIVIRLQYSYRCFIQKKMVWRKQDIHTYSYKLDCYMCNRLLFTNASFVSIY